jgi:four helix bundle protein
MGTGLSNLIVYQKAFELAMNIFITSKSFPKEEMYSLTDQIRRSSRAVCANLAEGYAKRRYKAYFISKMSDANMENTETQVWLGFANKCGYIRNEDYQKYYDLSIEVGNLVNYMIKYPNKFSAKS